MTPEECYATNAEAHYVAKFISLRDGSDLLDVVHSYDFEESVPLIERMNELTEEIRADVMTRFVDRSPEGLILIPADGTIRPPELSPKVVALVEERKKLVAEFVEKMGLPTDLLETPA